MMTTTAQLISNLQAEIAELKRELENERARDIHSCGPNCQRTGCVNRRLREENEALRKAYWKMRNAAAGYSNFCEDSASTRRCERDYEEAESMFRAMKGQ